MKITLIFKKIFLFFSLSFFLFSCSCNKINQNLDFFEIKYITENIENDLLFYFAEKKFGNFQEIEKIVNKKNDNLHFLKKYTFYRNNFDNVKSFYKKTKNKIYEKIYEEIKDEYFQDEYLFNEEKFVEKLKGNGFNIIKKNKTYKKKIIPIFKGNQTWGNFINEILEDFYSRYVDYIIKKIIPEIYCNYLIIEHIKENEKSNFGTIIQAYKIKSVLIPKEKNTNYSNNKNKNDLLNLFMKYYLNNEIELNQINNLITGLLYYDDNLSKEVLDKCKTINYNFATKEDGNLNSMENEIEACEETLIGKLNEDYLKKDSFEKNIRIKKNKILEERKIRLKNFVKSGWYIKNDLSFGEKINKFLENEFYDKNFDAIKNKKSGENIKCLNKKCFFKKENIVGDENVIFYDEDNFYVIEIENVISDINKITGEEVEQISEIFLKKDDNYNKYKKKILENLIKNQDGFLNFKKKEVCVFFEKQYSDSFNKKIKCE